MVIESWAAGLDFTYHVTDARTQVIFVTSDRCITEQYNTFQVSVSEIPESLKVRCCVRGPATAPRRSGPRLGSRRLRSPLSLPLLYTYFGMGVYGTDAHGGCGCGQVVVPENRVAPGVFTLPIYRFCGRTDDFGHYLFDFDIDQRVTVADLKTQLLQRMNEEGVGLKVCLTVYLHVCTPCWSGRRHPTLHVCPPRFWVVVLISFAGRRASTILAAVQHDS